jgi:hypothetical protein
LRAQLVERLLGLREVEIHPLEDPICLRELDLVVLHDLDEVPARVAEVEASAGEDLDARLLERPLGCLLVVDDQSEMLGLAAFEEREELVAQSAGRRRRGRSG